jgi:hypothetical protein
MYRILCIFLFCFLFGSLHSQERKLALVIGNSTYAYGGSLRTPANDAYAIQNALRQAGFEVMDHYDLDQRGMISAIDDFGSRLRNFQVGLFYYSGHGVQVEGKNYLIPVDADITSEEEVKVNCISVEMTLAHMQSSGSGVNIMILDACRNNPFERNWNMSIDGTGLAPMEAPEGSVIAMSASPGRTADEGDGENGIYAEAFLESMSIPGTHLKQHFKNIKDRVSSRSGNEQVPWESIEVKGKFYLKDNFDEEDLATAEKKRKEERKKEIRNKETTSSYIAADQGNKKDNFRTGIILQSVAVPGLGLTRLTGEPHFIKGAVGYGCIAGSLVLYTRAKYNYENNFKEAYDPLEAEEFLNRACLQDNLSEALAYTAAGIWIMDMIWTIIRTDGLTKENHDQWRSGFSLDGGFHPVLKTPVVGFVYRF